jgi:hypothetical protein
MIKPYIIQLVVFADAFAVMAKCRRIAKYRVGKLRNTEQENWEVQVGKLGSTGRKIAK